LRYCNILNSKNLFCVEIRWGIVERRGARQYDWQAYLQVAELAKNAGISVQAVMSFHRCGGNVGDDCDIKLPEFVLQVGRSNDDIFYKDYRYSADTEYITLGADNSTLFSGRTPIQMYVDFMNSFATTFRSYFPSTITEIQVGLGPAGEMRYPGYQSDKGWNYCGIGEFQTNDRYMRAMLQSAANANGHPEWGNGPPNNAGSYNSQPPSQVPFFSNGFDNYRTAYGQFFLNFYSGALLTHGQQILCAANSIFSPLRVQIAGKISGIHWWYADQSHAAELTTGYYNTNGNNAYLQIARMFKQCNTVFDFTALEMVDSSDCGSRPIQLVEQTMQAARQAGVLYSGENALDFCKYGCSRAPFDQIYNQATKYGPIFQFTFLRLAQSLLEGNNWNEFRSFVARMNAV